MSTRDDQKPPAGFSPVDAPAFDGKIRRLDRLANLGLISASIAHEIKNGLVPINTFIELLLEGKGSDQELSQTVQRELRRIDGLVSQMMRFAGPDRSVPQAAPLADASIHELFGHTLRLLNYPLNAKLIKVEQHFNAGAGVVHGNEAQLQQVLMNLLLNAVEAMEKQGTITLSTTLVTQTEGRPPQILIEVKDTGTGISRENLSRLFEPFFTTKKDGNGLGLTICERIIHEHHGSISAQSEVGKGSTFSILLPFVK